MATVIYMSTSFGCGPLCTANTAEILIRWKLPAAVGAEHLLGSIRNACGLIDWLPIRLRNGYLVDRSFLFIRMCHPPTEQECHWNQEQDRQTVYIATHKIDVSHKMRKGDEDAENTRQEPQPV